MKYNHVRFVLTLSIVWSLSVFTVHAQQYTPYASPTPNIIGQGPSFCSAESLEEPFSISAILPSVSLSQQKLAREHMESWNNTYARVIEGVRLNLYDFKKRGDLPPNFEMYKSGVLSKLTLMERFGLAGCLQIKLPASSPAQRKAAVIKLFANFEAKAPKTFRADGTECTDQTPGGICWCNFDPLQQASLKEYAAQFLKCARLSASTTITGKVGKDACYFVANERGEFSPSSGCTCEDAAPGYISVSNGKEMRCVPSLMALLRQKGEYQVVAPPERVWDPDPIESFEGDTCVPDPTGNGGKICASRKSALTLTSISSGQSLPPLTKKYLSAGFAEMDSMLKSSFNGISSSPILSPSLSHDWVPGDPFPPVLNPPIRSGPGKEVPKECVKHGYVSQQRCCKLLAGNETCSGEKAPPSNSGEPGSGSGSVITPGGSQDPGGSGGGDSWSYPIDIGGADDGSQDAWANMADPEIALYSVVTQITLNAKVLEIDPNHQSLIPPESVPGYVLMSQRYPSYRPGLERVASLASVTNRIDFGNKRVGDAQDSLKRARNIKRLGLLQLKELAAQSRIFEEKTYKALVVKTSINVAFTAISIGLQSTPLTAPLKVVVSGVGTLVGQGAALLVGPGAGPTDSPVEKTVAVCGKESGKVAGKEFIKYGVWTSLWERFTKALLVYDGGLPKKLANLKSGLDYVKRNASVVKVAKNVGGTLASGLSTGTSAFIDIDGYVHRNISVDNPYEVAMNHQEQTMKAINRSIAELKQELSSAYLYRKKALEEARRLYCRQADGSETQDPSVCGEK